MRSPTAMIDNSAFASASSSAQGSPLDWIALEDSSDTDAADELDFPLCLGYQHPPVGYDRVLRRYQKLRRRRRRETDLTTIPEDEVVAFSKKKGSPPPVVVLQRPKTTSAFGCLPDVAVGKQRCAAMDPGTASHSPGRAVDSPSGDDSVAKDTSSMVPLFITPPGARVSKVSNPAMFRIGSPDARAPCRGSKPNRDTHPGARAWYVSTSSSASAAFPGRHRRGPKPGRRTRQMYYDLVQEARDRYQMKMAWSIQGMADKFFIEEYQRGDASAAAMLSPEFRELDHRMKVLEQDFADVLK